MTCTMNAFAVQLGYENWTGYLQAFITPAGRADMADKFLSKAFELNLDVDVTYE
tara:strand:- start:3753 stop:3914 length:162 start_codon:yes stop_codon:yes gene_type:complete